MRKEFSYIQGYPLIEVILIGPKEKIKMLALVSGIPARGSGPGGRYCFEMQDCFL